MSCNYENLEKECRKALLENSGSEHLSEALICNILEDIANEVLRVNSHHGWSFEEALPFATYEVLKRYR